MDRHRGRQLWMRNKVDSLVGWTFLLSGGVVLILARGISKFAVDFLKCRGLLFGIRDFFDVAFVL